MTIAEKIARAKTDLDEVYEAGRNSIISGVGTVVDKSISVFKQVPVNSISHCYISSLGGYTHVVPDDSSILAPIRLENAKPMGLKVHSANWIPFPYDGGKDVGYTYTTKGVTYTVNADRSITINGTPTINTSVIFGNYYNLPDGDYVFSANHISGEWVSGVYIRNTAQDIRNNHTVTKFTSPNKKLTWWGIYVEQGTTENNLTFKPMLNRGTTALPYTDYKAPITYTLPESITSLTNLGLGIYDNEYNEVDLVNGKYYSRCNTKTLVGTEAFKYSKLGSRSRFQLARQSDERPNSLPYYTRCDYLKTDKTVDQINEDDSLVNLMTPYQYQGWFFYVDGTLIPDLDTWKAYLAEHNMEVVYELNQESVTDLDIGDFNPLMEVEAGGVIEFITDSGYAPNSTVIFQTIS
jgi:hypothetical protein